MDNIFTTLRLVSGSALLGAALVGSFNAKFDWVGALIGVGVGAAYTLYTYLQHPAARSDR